MLKNNPDNSIDKAYCFKSTTNFEYLWFRDLHIVIQESLEPPSKLKPYAKILSENSKESKDLLEYVKSNNLIQEISIEEFKNKSNRAFEIVKENLK